MSLRKMEGRTRWRASSLRSWQEERIPVRTPPQRTIIASTTIKIRNQGPPDYKDCNEYVIAQKGKYLTTSASEMRTFAPPNTTSSGNTAKTSTIITGFRMIAGM
jgi:hypothetical protein